MANYHAYLIRFWRDGEQLPWRGELLSPHTGEQRRFSTAAQLLAFLAAQIETDEAETTDENETFIMRNA